MKRHIFKTGAISFVLIFIMVFSCFSAAAAKKASGDVWKKVGLGEETAILSNDKLTLSVDADDGDVVLTDVRNQIQYSSSCAQGIENNWVVGPQRLAFLSQVSINVIDKLGSLSTVYSFNGAVREEGFTLYRSENALRAEYKFVNEGVTLSLEYRLDGDRLIVDIPTDKILVKGEYGLADIDVLPYFGAATPEDEGQMLIPSGSGALIDFNNDKGSYGRFEQKVYGNDAMDLMEYKTEQGELILFPMYSLMFENSPKAFIAYVENGAPLATLRAAATDSDSSLTTAYFSFNYHPYTLVNPLNTDSQSVMYNQFTGDKAQIDKFTLSYQFFPESKTYFDMAKVLRGKMLDSGVETDKDALANKLYIELLMGVNKTVYTAGLPHKTCYPLTTLKQASEIAENFGEMPVVMIMKGLDSDGAYGGKIDTSFSINSKIGTRKEYFSLYEKLKKDGGALYAVTNPTEYTKSSFGFSKLFHAARSVTGKNLLIYRYRYGDGQQNTEIPPLNLLVNTKIQKGVGKFIKSALKNKVSAVAPLSLSNSPYTCNNGNGDRNQVFSAFRKALDSYRDADIDLLLSAPVNEFMGYADNIYALPINSGKHKIFDEDIPFVQLVLNSLRNYSTPALNAGYGSQMLLKALESGSSPSLSLYASEFDDIYDTPLRDYVSSEYTVQRESLSSQLEEYRSAAEEFSDCAIVGHTVLSENVHRADYSNGKSVVVNYGNTDYMYGESAVKANSYLVTEGGGSDE